MKFNMKLTQIAVAVAALAAAPTAFALTPAQVLANDASTVKLWISGASAPTASAYAAFKTLCKDTVAPIGNAPDDLHVYIEKTVAGSVYADHIPGASGAGNMLAYACTIDVAKGGSLAGRRVVLYHTVDGGSFNAYTPHLTIAGDTNVNLPGNLKRTPNVKSLVCTTTVGVVNTTTPPIYEGCGSVVKTFAAGNPHRNDETTGNAIKDVFDDPSSPEGGQSDTEYAINQANLAIATPLSSIGNDVATNVGQAFGVGVSYALYFKLQQNEVAAGKLAATCTDVETAVAPNFTAACQPSMPRANYTMLADAATGKNQNASIFGGVATDFVHLCRRVGTSGTQSVSNLTFLDMPCAVGSNGRPTATPISGAFTSTAVPNYTTYTGDFGTGALKVSENSGSGNVKTCLNDASTTKYSLGLLSMENTPAPTATADRYAFVKLNESSPNFYGAAIDPDQRKNAMDANYEVAYELVSFTASAADPEGIDVIDKINVALGSPAITNLKGLFLTSAAVDPDTGLPSTGTNVSKFARGANSCALIRR